MRYKFQTLKDHARARGIVFALPFPLFRRFALVSEYLNRTGNGNHCLTVDRINNLRGYVPGNIQPLTREENRMKQAKVDAHRMSAGMAWQKDYA